MDWQKVVSLVIVGLTAGSFVWNRFRSRRFSFERDTHCGCSQVGGGAPQGSMVFRARRGERPEILMRMK